MLLLCECCAQDGPHATQTPQAAYVRAPFEARRGGTEQEFVTRLPTLHERQHDTIFESLNGIDSDQPRIVQCRRQRLRHLVFTAQREPDLAQKFFKHFLDIIDRELFGLRP